MAKKEVVYQGLAELPVIIDDTSVNSPDYFRVTKLPTEFTAGVNVFEFKGNPSLFREGVHIYVEVLDSNGEPVYYETNLDLESESQSAIISVFIDSDTRPGNGTIAICSTAYKDVAGNKLPTSKINVRWSSKIFIDPSKRNASEIVFGALPAVTIFGTTGSYTNLGYPGGNKFATSEIYNLQYLYRNTTPLLITSSLSTTGFDTTALGASVNIAYNNLIDNNPAAFGTVNTSSAYTSVITAISSSGIAFLSDPIDFPVYNSNSVYQLSSATAVTASITYEQSASLTPDVTQNTHNLVIAYFAGLQPQIGTVSKIRSYYRSAGVGEYIFSNETDITGQAPEYGFTADVISASFAVHTVHRNDHLDFKFEFVNPYGSVSKQVVESLNNLFLGGNTYIGGKDNLLTGSLYVAGATGTGVEITGEGNSAMVRSIGYTGFHNAVSGSGAGGFVMYSGSIQPIIGSYETYSGVGLELVANSSSYFKYQTSGSGMLDIRTLNFFLGNSSSYISDINGAMTIYTPYFTVSPVGVVTASALHVDKSYTVDSIDYSAIMIDTSQGILDAKNLGRNLYNSMNEYVTQSFISGSTWQYFPGPTFVFQGLPNEFRYTVTYQQRLQTGAGTFGTSLYPRSFLRFRLYSCDSGSTGYDDSNFTLVSTNVETGSYTSRVPGGIIVYTGSNSIKDYTFSEDVNLLDRGIDLSGSLAQYQGKLFKGVIDFAISTNNISASGSVTASFKNICVNGSRGMSGIWNGQFNPAQAQSPRF
jgi:hypothetical protein